MEQTNQKPLQKEKKPRSLGRTAGLIAGIAVGVLAAAYIAVCAVAAAGGTTLRGTQVLGVDVGGLTAQQVRDKWQREGDAACRKETIDLTLEDQVIGTVNLTELGVSVTPQEAAQAAWNAAHGGNFFVNGYHLIRSWFGDTQAQVQWDLDAGQLSQRAESLSRELSLDPVDGAYRMEEGKGDGFYVIKAADGRTIDRDKLARALHQAVTTRCMDPIPCVSTTTQGKPLDLAALEQEIGGQGKNASYDRSTGQVVEGRVGVTFDVAGAEKLVEDAQPGQEIVIPAQITYPTVTKAELEKVLFRDVLGQYTSYVSGTSDRIFNVRKAAGNISGSVVNSGENFSYNNAVGPTTKEAGFKIGTAYVGGKAVPSYGGGVCQVSSTLYYSALLANLKIVSRACHMYAQDYVPSGCDATVFWPYLDFVLQNNTDYPIKIVTYWHNNNVTVKIFGTKTDSSFVKITSKTVSTTPWKTIYKEVDSLAPGAERVTQYPITGFTVQTWRNVYDGNGNLISSSFEAESNYDSRDKIVEVGKQEPQPEEPKKPDPEQELLEAKRRLDDKLQRVAFREKQLEQQKKELEELKERCVQQGKDIILEAKNRAESIIRTANHNASRIVSAGKANRDSVYIKAKAEGFEQGTRDGREACLAAGRDILDEAKSYADRINSEKEQLFADYEKEIYDTVMQIAKKVTLDSITSKDSAAVKRLIKKAAKEFRNCERIKITLNDNGANEELTGDYEYLKELCGGIPNVEVELLPEADPGTVIVDNGSEIVDAGIMTQLRMIQELGDGKFREPKPTRKKKKPAPEPAEEADAEE